MTGSPGQGVVVGIDGSTHSDQALDWAADEAARRGVPLRIAYAWVLAPYQVPPSDRGDIAEGVAEGADELLRAAQERVRKQHADLEVTGELLTESAAQGLIRLAEDAELLVVGSRGLGRFPSMLLGSVSQSLVAHAPCPVVVLRGGEAPEGAGVEADAPVVLGAGPGEVAAPVRFAFAEAARRGVPLLVVRAWQCPPNTGGYIQLLPEDTPRRENAEREELGRALADARAAFPGVRTVEEVGMHEPAWALVDASARACLLVIGAERRRHRFAMPIGRVAQQVLHHAHCPVTVVPHP